MQKKAENNTLIDLDLILAKANIATDMKVADLGCGPIGHFVFPLSKVVGPGGMVYAVDILKPTLDNIKHRVKQENLQNIETVWSNLESFNATTIDSSSLDRILLINTLYQSNKRVEIIKEAIRMLKTGGTITVVEWKNANIPFGPKIEERVQKESLMKAAPKLGLEEKVEFSAGPYHYGLIFEKI
jgi:ubiquinone/menaquinone biosynthesis C-methylase UbiE